MSAVRKRSAASSQRRAKVVVVKKAANAKTGELCPSLVKSDDSAELVVASCACGLNEIHGQGRKAVGVDSDAKERNIKRLRRVEGQVRGIEKMVLEDRYCADILVQISSIHEALRAVGRELMRNHLKHCATAAIRGGNDSAEAMYDELVDMMYKHSR